MRSLLLLAACVACVAAFCPPPFRWRRYVYAKGQAKENDQGHEVTKGLRVDLVSYYPRDPKNVTVLASADADDTGFYVIAGSTQVGRYFKKQYGLRLYADKLDKHPVLLVENGPNHDRIDVPSEYVLGEDRSSRRTSKD